MAPRDRNNSKRSPSSEGDYTRHDLERDFPDDASCLSYLWRRNLSPDGEHAHCPKCDEVRKFHRVKARPSYSCDVCGLHLHPTAGTIFHKSSTGLDLWFKAVFLMASTRCGLSAKQLEREIGVTYKTAWRMARLIRTRLMAQDETPLDGEVEADETFMGGKARAYPKMSLAEHRARKAVVFGAVQRTGQLRAEVVPSTHGEVLREKVREFVLPATTLYTDEYHGYRELAEFTHRRIYHAARVYVRGDVHTNTVEGFFGLLKNGIRGTYHSVSKRWLHGYLNEFVWRYNHREDTEPMFKTLLALASRRELAAS